MVQTKKKTGIRPRYNPPSPELEFVIISLLDIPVTSPEDHLLKIVSNRNRPFLRRASKKNPLPQLINETTGKRKRLPAAI